MIVIKDSIIVILYVIYMQLNANGTQANTTGYVRVVVKEAKTKKENIKPLYLHYGWSIDKAIAELKNVVGIKEETEAHIHYVWNYNETSSIRVDFKEIQSIENDIRMGCTIYVSKIKSKADISKEIVKKQQTIDRSMLIIYYL